MALKPLTINAGQIEQLASGQALDVGGWNLPTAGGTENYVLIADSSGHAVWSSVLAGLTSLTVDNITIDGAVITSDTGTISFSNENLSTSGTVVGSNIPSPTVDDQILISTAANAASWSTAGNNQILASDGAGEVAWANKSFGYSIPANSAINQVYVGTGAGTAAWTTDLAGLTSLTVDNITIDAATITSDTGTISFDDENLSTTGDLTVGRVISWRDNSGGADAAGIFTRFQAGGGIPNSVVRVIFEEDSAGESVLVDGTGPAIQFENKNEEEATNIIAKIAARRREDDDSSGSLDFYTYSGGVETCGGRFNPDGSFSLLKGLEVTGGPVVGSNVPSPTVDDQVLISTAADTASWSTAGNDQYLASNGSGDVAWANKPVAMANPTADDQLLVATGAGTASWTTTLDILTVDNITINGAVITSDTGAINFSNENLSTSGTVVGSNIPSPIVDDQVLISTASGVAGWQTAGNDQYLASNGSGEVTWIAKPTLASNPTADDQVLISTGVDAASWSTASTNQVLASDGAGEVAWVNKSFGYNIPANSAINQIYTGTGAGTAAWTTDLAGITSLTVDNITIDGAVISSDTGAISFSNENLSTSGTMVGSNIPSPTVDDQVLISTASGIAAWSTAGNNQYLASDGSGEVAWANKPVAMANPTADDQLLVATGAGAASWTDTLDILTVDNITINGAVITSDTGAISFSNENLTTTGKMMIGDTGTVYVNSMVEIAGPYEGAKYVSQLHLRVDSETYGMFLGAGSESWGAVGVGAHYFSGGSYRPTATTAGIMNIQTDGFRFMYDEGLTPGNNYVPTTRLQVDETGVSVNGALDADSLTIDNITINAATITSDTGAISFSNENLTSTGKIVGKNIPSPSVSGKALVSTAADTAAWYTTGLYDVLKIEVPSASGAERKYVLTADPSSQFEIEPAPWPLTLTANETVYVRTTGNDTTGDGSASFPFLTLNRTIEYLGGLYIGDYAVTVDIGEGTFTEAYTITFMHPFGSQVLFQGVSERIDNVDTTSISGTTSYGHNQLYYRDVTMVLPIGKSVAVGNYIGIATATGGTNPNALVGIHKVSDWVSGTRTATIQVSYRDGSETPSGTITCDIDLVKSVIAFSDKNGIKIIGPLYGGNWFGLVIQGDYDGANDAKNGVWALNGAVVTLSGGDTSGFACGVWGFQTNLYAQNNGLVYADYSYATKAGGNNCSCQNGGILGLRYSRISASKNSGIYAFNGSTVAAFYVTVVGTGDNSIISSQGSFIDMQNAFVGESASTTSVLADRWAAIDGTGATVDDAISPVTDGNNDGSYVIGL